MAPYVRGETKVVILEEQLLLQDSILREFKSNLTKAQSRMNSLADKHRNDKEFSVEDAVYLKLQPYRQCSFAT